MQWEKVGPVSSVFFYCGFREGRKEEFRGLLPFLVQLYRQSDSYFDILSNFYSVHDTGSRLLGDNSTIYHILFEDVSLMARQFQHGKETKRNMISTFPNFLVLHYADLCHILRIHPRLLHQAPTG